MILIANAHCKRLEAAEKEAVELHKALMLAYDAKVFCQKHCYLLAHFSDVERGTGEGWPSSDWRRGIDDTEPFQRHGDIPHYAVPPSNVRDFYNYGVPCPPPALDGAGPYRAYPRDPCESTDNFPPDAWRPHNDSQPALTCHLRDGHIITPKEKRPWCRAYVFPS